MVASIDIVVFGTGSFAGRIVCDIAATAARPVTVAIAGRNRDRLRWLKVAGNARAAIFERPASFIEHPVDLDIPEAAEAAIAGLRPSVAVPPAGSVRPRCSRRTSPYASRGRSGRRVRNAASSIAAFPTW
jgi:hypothetical protein